ncbi:TPA: proteasome subunit beta, partial [Candidatus Poribacteria bacterium]|nr:proteasome subunit beta [Candidatus Poribacteria bacterium]
KIEGTFLSLEGKANYLSNMLRSNLQLAVQGLIVIPIFAGYDLSRKCGHIYKYDIAGGRYEQEDYDAEGSGGKDARSSLKKLYRPDMSREDILKIVVAALWDAADEDLGTAGPDLLRNIFPTIKTITHSGVEDVDESEIKDLFTDLFEQLSKQLSK